MSQSSGLLAESLRISRASPAVSIVIALVTAATCALVLATAGRSAAAEQRVMDSIDRAGARLIVLTNSSGDGGPDVALADRAQRIAEVEWALGLGAAIDVRNEAVPGGGTVAGRGLYGGAPRDLILLSGRWPAPGEAVIGERAIASLGLTSASGGLRSVDDVRHWDVVGTFRATGPLEDLDRLVLTSPHPSDTLALLYAVVRSPERVAAASVALADVSGAGDSSGLTVETSSELVALGSVVSGQLGAASRQQAMAAMVAGLAFETVTLYSVIGARRRDFGRRRALGATRSTLITLVMLQAFWPATIGALAGSGAGTVLLVSSESMLPPFDFVLAVAVLALVIAAIAAVPAAIAAALRDPVRILRVA